MAFAAKQTNLPSSKNTEQAVISLMLKHSDNVLKSSSLSKEDFYDEDSSKVFEAIQMLKKEGHFIDQNTVADRAGIGTIKLNQFTSINSSSDNLENYVKVLKSKTLERKLVEASNKINEVVYKDDLTGDEKFSTCSSALSSLSYNLEDKTISLTAGYSKFMDNLKNKVANKGKAYVSWGFEEIDHALGGMATGLHILAANTGMGKTSLADQIADYNATKGFKGLFFSCEMDYDELMYRKIQRELNISVNRMRRGDLWDREIEKIEQFQHQLSDNLFVNDVSNLDVNRLKAIAHLQKAKTGLDFIVIDYLQLLTVKIGKDGGNQYEKVTEISKQLKALSKELKIPVLALAQLNRNNQARETKQPVKSDLRDSGSIEQDADSITFIHRDDYFDPKTPRKGISDIIIAKNRYGECKTIALKWIASQTKFVERPRPEDDDYIPDFEENINEKKSAFKRK